MVLVSTSSEMAGDMTVLHLHIGMHKTGTSAFQNACDAHRARLLDSGVFYHLDRLSAIPNHSYFRDVMEQRKPGTLEASLREAFAGKTSPNYLISGEDISYLSVENLEILAALFREFFSEIRVYAVVRPPIGYMHSATQEIVKNPVTDIAGLFNRWDVTPSYEKRFQKFIDMFGAVRFIAYGPNALTALATAIGIPSLDYRRDNRSVSRWTVKMLAAMKPFPTWDAAHMAADALNAMNKNREIGYHAPIELVGHWADQIAKDRAWLESVWEAPSGFFDEPPPFVPRSYYETFSLEEVQIIRSLSV